MIEAEGRSLRREAWRVGGAWIMLFVAAMLGLAAAATGGIALHHWLAPALGRAGALFILAVLALTIGGILTWLAMKIVNDH